MPDYSKRFRRVLAPEPRAGPDCWVARNVGATGEPATSGSCKLMAVDSRRLRSVVGGRAGVVDASDITGSGDSLMPRPDTQS